MYLIENIGVMGAARTGGTLGGEGGGGEIHGPEHHPGGGEVDRAGVHHPEDFGAVAGKVTARVRDAPAENKGVTASAGHVVEAGAGPTVMAAAGASANGGTLTVAAIGEDVATGSND